MYFFNCFLFLSLAAATPQNKCNQDACYKDVMKGSDPRAQCSKSFVKTVTAPPSTKKTTITVTSSVTETSTYTVGTTTVTASAVPIAARNAQCCDSRGFSSVCSCLGITPSTTTVCGTTTTQTITVTSTKTQKQTVTKTSITSTVTATAQTSAAPCRIKNLPGVNQDTGTSSDLYLTSPRDSDGLFVQTTAIISEAWYWYLEGGVLKTVNTTVIPHGNANNEIVVSTKNNVQGNVLCSQVAGALACRFVNAPAATIFVDDSNRVKLLTPDQYAAEVAEFPLTQMMSFQFDC